MEGQINQQILLPMLQQAGVTRFSPPDVQQAAIQRARAELDGISLQALYERLGYRYDASLEERRLERVS